MLEKASQNYALYHRSQCLGLVVNVAVWSFLRDTRVQGVHSDSMLVFAPSCRLKMGLSRQSVAPIGHLIFFEAATTQSG